MDLYPAMIHWDPAKRNLKWLKCAFVKISNCATV